MDISDLIARTKQETEQAKAQLLKTLEFVPDDKLTWSPSPSARTPLWIVAHCGAANGAFATILRGEELAVPKDPEELARRVRAGGKDIQTREAAIALVEENTAKVLAALDNVTEEMAESVPESPLGRIPYR